jgi:octaprenyl-diphosphate synthase
MRDLDRRHRVGMAVIRRAVIAAVARDFGVVISGIAPSVCLNMSRVARAAATADPKSHAFANAFAMLAPHLAELDRFLLGQLAAFEPEIRPRVEHCLHTSGHRIRSALVFLSGWRGVGDATSDLVRVAAVVELIHLATLVHDHIMDESELHRGPTASREFGPTPAVLLGDALFAHGLHLATQFPTTEICAAITVSTRRVCAGNIVQTLRQRSTDLTRADYQRIVELKTAELFRVSCFLGTRLAGAEPDYAEAAGRFGRHLGTAYQIYEDLVDCCGAETRLGRTVGADRAISHVTLPLLILLERLSGAEAGALRAEMAGERPPQLAVRRRQMRELAIFTAIAAAFEAELTAARAALGVWPGQPATPLLLGLCAGLQAQVVKLRPAGAV